MMRLKPILTAIACVGMVPLAACNDQAAETGEAEAEAVSNETLAANITGLEGHSTLAGAITNTGLSTLLDGTSDYTILAPDDAAFAKLGDAGKTLMENDQKAVMVAVLRDHLIPGELTVDAIRTAIADKGGPVTMRTMGSNSVTFSQEGDRVMVKGSDGSAATIIEPAITAANGSLIKVDAVLVKSGPNG
ncbi:hypothetical protein GRI44_01610 [Altererythrobacter confluentis]|uniref:FAS1 domain-containing protein n=1 Tax=Allopontixanthobacter confluentis TaxID=1849021 RepID=A0A6L7GFL4_9SPHN|nr:fasciclin domain-containing protein [Allopontixanthobacter confluentis]MXP13451.1 hypothetical protein [Allopontixanthobacter confluentis]